MRWIKKHDHHFHIKIPLNVFVGMVNGHTLTITVEMMLV